MSDPAEAVKARLKELAELQRTRHLSETELWEAADLLRQAGREVAAREAEAAALRQRARDTLQSPDATFSVGEEADQIAKHYCRVCGKVITAEQAEKNFDHCDEHAQQ